jgi:branched-chain amino acid transport system ATP-binding protein
MLLEMKNITVHYDKVAALKDISLRVEEGQIVTIIGANGAGKSTTLRTISGLKRATHGEILFEGKNITAMKPENIVEMGIAHVPEGRRVFGNMTVYENIFLGAFTRKKKDEIEKDFEYIYKLFPILSERKNQLAGTLSGGQQQMLAMARALMARPKLMLLDEPTMGLAPIMVSLVAEIIKEMHQNGTSVLLVEQNARVALRLADKGYVLETGSVVLEGESKEMISNDYIKESYLGA